MPDSGRNFTTKPYLSKKNFQLRAGIHGLFVPWRLYPTCFYFYVYRMFIAVMVRSYESEGVVLYRNDKSMTDAPPWWGFTQVVASRPTFQISCAD